MLFFSSCDFSRGDDVISDAVDSYGNPLIILSKNPDGDNLQMEVHNLQSLAEILNIAGLRKLAEARACIEGNFMIFARFVLVIIALQFNRTSGTFASSTITFSVFLHIYQ
jgi:hypothetical protein